MKKLQARNFLMSLTLILLAGCAHGLVPVGGVVDWYRPNASVPLPDGYMIADGRIVTDTGSPLFNQRLPDLRSRFVRGAANQSEVGAAGGFFAHSHALTLSPINTSDVVETDHDHQWAKFDKTNKRWSAYSGSSELLLVDWGDGLDNEGSGIYPLAFDDSTLAHISGTVFLTTTTQSGRTIHHHEVTFPSGTATAISANEPPYVMLLKIVRIK